MYNKITKLSIPSFNKEEEDEWQMIKLFIKNNCTIGYRLPTFTNKMSNLTFSINDKKYILQIYHNNYDYLQTNDLISEMHKNSNDEIVVQQMCFIIAITFSNNVQIVKFLIDKFKINKNNTEDFESFNNIMIFAFIHNSYLPISEFIIEEINFSLMNWGDLRDYFQEACLKNSNLSVIKTFAIALHEKTNCIVFVRTMNCNEISKSKNKIRYDRHLEIIKYLIENTNILSQNNIKKIFLFGSPYFNFEMAEEYIFCIKDQSLLRKFIEEMCECYEKGMNSLSLLKIIPAIHRKNSLLLTDRMCDHANVKRPLEENFETFVSLVNGLTHRIHLRENKKTLQLESENEQKAKRMRYDFSSEKIIPLFTHYDNQYSGNPILLDSIYLMKEISNCCEMKDIELSIKVPKYIVNLYILSLHTERFCINDIEVVDLIDFLKFIEAYETKTLSPWILEEDLINYFEKNNIHCEEYLMSMCQRHKLKNMYLYFKNKELL